MGVLFAHVSVQKTNKFIRDANLSKTQIALNLYNKTNTVPTSHHVKGQFQLQI